MDRDTQRQNRRAVTTSPSCTAGYSIESSQLPQGRPDIKCTTGATAPAAFPFVSPETCPPRLAPALVLPDGLIVGSDATQAFCPTYPGYGVTGATAVALSANDQQQTVIFSGLPGITENQLTYLSQVVPSSATAIISAALASATADVVDLTHLNYEQSESLAIGIQSAKNLVNSLAVDKARNLLICQAFNDTQSATCPTAAYFGATAAVPPDMPYAPTAQVIQGTTLVTFALTPTSGNQDAFAALNIPSLTAAAAQANIIANAQANSLLSCVYANGATTASCCTAQSPNNLGYVYCVPSLGPVIEGTERAVGFVTVDANTVFSAVSKLEAEAAARELALSSLNCYFPSDVVAATCAGTGFAGDAISSITLPAGAVILVDITGSVTAANIQALALAEASLNCYWANDLVTVFCPTSGPFVAINGLTYDLDASPTLSLNFSSTVLANTVISYGSKEDANDIALEQASASLSCIYCNNEVFPSCPSAVNETVGASANLVCNILAPVAQNTAISLAAILTSSNGGSNCCYGNDAVVNTVFCGDGAYRAPNTNFTSADDFSLPADVFTLCENATGPTAPTALFSYSNIFATDAISYGCCADLSPCGITGSATAMGTLYAAQTDLFNFVGTGATFYLDQEGTIAATFPGASTHIVQRSGTAARLYRGVTGGPGFTLGLTACEDCGVMPAYIVRGAALSEFGGSTATLLQDVFCVGATADVLTLYTAYTNPFAGSATAVPWFTDACGATAFTPKNVGSTSNYFIGYIVGATGYSSVFSTSGGNTSAYGGVYGVGSCPESKYPYFVYPSASPCSTAGVGVTLYTGVTGAFTTQGALELNFYSTFFNDASIYSASGGVVYLNWPASGSGGIYTRPITGVTAAAAGFCSPLERVTVYYSNTDSDTVCMHPWTATDDYPTSYPNENIITLWSDLASPFSTTGSAQLYTIPFSSAPFLFKPGASAPGTTVYVSEYSPGLKRADKYRVYTHGSPASILQDNPTADVTAPFLQVIEGATSGVVWEQDRANFAFAVCNEPVTRRILAPGSTACTGGDLYSDVKEIFVGSTHQEFYKKILPVNSYSAGAVFAGTSGNIVFNDGYMLRLSVGATGTVNGNAIQVTDTSKMGALFEGAIIRSDGYQLGGSGAAGSDTTICPYVESYDEVTGDITLGGYYNKVVQAMTAGTELFVVGFHTGATAWTSSSFSCTGHNCDKLEVGQAIYSFRRFSSSTQHNLGFITRIVGATAYFSSPDVSLNNFTADLLAPGATHGSGHVYVYGKYLARLWEDENGATPVDSTYSSNATYDSHMFKDESDIFFKSQMLVLGNTAGSTAEFGAVLAPIYGRCASPISIPFSEAGPIYYDAGTYYSDLLTYYCDGSTASVPVVLSEVQVPAFDSCCAVAEASGGATATCCEWKTVMGADVPALVTAGYLELVDGTRYFVPGTGDLAGATALADYIMQDGSGTPFRRVFFSSGLPVFSLPCNATDDAGVDTTVYRTYLGYYEPGVSTPYDMDGTTPVDSPSYWLFNDNTTSPDGSGHIFREWVTDTANPAGCNCGNFTWVELSYGSGNRFSAWDSPEAGYAALTNPPPLYPTEPPAELQFNYCATGCTAGYTCTFPMDCDGAVLGMIEGGDYLPDFSFAPAVGSTADTLKAQVTELAQNLVNSFVKCFYFNTAQTGKDCDDPAAVLIQRGYIAGGEVMSTISQEAANIIAKNTADSLTVCIDTDILPPPVSGCEGTIINNAPAQTVKHGQQIALTWNKDLCTFTPSIDVSGSINFRQIYSKTSTIRKLKICAADGSSIDIYVPDFGGNEGETINLASNGTAGATEWFKAVEET